VRALLTYERGEHQGLFNWGTFETAGRVINNMQISSPSQWASLQDMRRNVEPSFCGLAPTPHFVGVAGAVQLRGASAKQAFY
jgi:hypothetical protein